MSNEYDKIIKENLQSLIEPLIRKVLALEVTRVEALTTKLQYTLEREADFLQKITTVDGRVFALHIEFQTANDRLMPERMLQYCGLIYRVYHLPVLQYVFYVGKGKLTMVDVLPMPHFEYRYELIDLRSFSYRTFLESTNPNEVVLAILCDFERDDQTLAVSEILRKLKELNFSGLQLQQHIRQLEVLAKIKDLQTVVLEEERKMAFEYDMETDIRFMQGRETGRKTGIEEGIERGIEQGIKKTAVGLLKAGIDLDVIRKATGLSLKTLKELQNDLNPNE